MSIDQQSILEVIYSSIDEINEQLAPENRLEKSPQTPLLGPGGLDSLGFVNFVVLIEDKCQQIFGLEIVLSEKDAGGASSDPFESVYALASYLEATLKSKAGSPKG